MVQLFLFFPQPLHGKQGHRTAHGFLTYKHYPLRDSLFPFLIFTLHLTTVMVLYIILLENISITSCKTVAWF